ncbi:MAG: hypothetical protein LM523_05770, partial [Candidatus Contendobacter sp.]|nr:hypothetical protein [Candidatus Contendobacter sp.]
MTDLHDEQPHETADEPIMEERRSFLRSLGKWSQAVIGGVLADGALMMASPVEAASWVNRHGGGGWVNRHGGGGWVNRHGGGGWVNRHGGGGWVNRHGGGGWANRSGGS